VKETSVGHLVGQGVLEGVARRSLAGVQTPRP
jgi:hypothetical protein